MEKITEYIQDSIITLLLQDKNFLMLSRASVSIELFDGIVRKEVCKIIYDYYDDYKEAPKEDFKDYLKTKLKETKLHRIYLRKIKNVEVNKKYVISQLIEWIQYQQLTGAVLKSAELIKDKKYKEVKQTILEAFNTQLNILDIGVDFWDFEYTGDSELDVVCKTGITTLDRKLQGYCRSELFLWLGATNVGKSWALVDGARSALLQGKNIVYYSLEMTTKNIMKRLGMAISGMRRQHDNSENEGLFITYSNGETVNVSDREVLDTTTETFKHTKAFYKNRKGRIIVKEGIEGRWTVNSIHSHLNQLEISGFAPDIIFIDYADLLTSDRKFKDKIHEIDDVFLNLRGLSKERNIAVVSATQGTRDSIDARRVGLRQTSGSIGKAKIADVVVTLNQTEQERQENIMRLFGAKVREGAKYWSIQILQALEIGGFCLEDEELIEMGED